jgi:hypothetical protein
MTETIKNEIFCIEYWNVYIVSKMFYLKAIRNTKIQTTE